MDAAGTNCGKYEFNLSPQLSSLLCTIICRNPHFCRPVQEIAKQGMDRKPFVCVARSAQYAHYVHYVQYAYYAHYAHYEQAPRLKSLPSPPFPFI